MAYFRNFVLVGMFFCVGGCTNGPAPPALDPPSVTAAAMKQLDKDGDGRLFITEYAESPPLVVALPRIDRDGNDVITREELEARIDYYINAPAAVVSGSVEVKLDGRLVDGATVTFIPEPFLGDVIKTTSGITDASGVAYLAGQDNEFPGLYLGLYRVTISKMKDGKETIDEKFNTKSELAYEVCTDLEYVSNVIQFAVTSAVEEESDR